MKMILGFGTLVSGILLSQTAFAFSSPVTVDSYLSGMQGGEVSVKITDSSGVDYVYNDDDGVVTLVTAMSLLNQEAGDNSNRPVNNWSTIQPFLYTQLRRVVAAYTAGAQATQDDDTKAQYMEAAAQFQKQLSTLKASPVPNYSDLKDLRTLLRQHAGIHTYVVQMSKGDLAPQQGVPIFDYQSPNRNTVSSHFAEEGSECQSETKGNLAQLIQSMQSAITTRSAPAGSDGSDASTGQ